MVELWFNKQKLGDTIIQISEHGQLLNSTESVLRQEMYNFYGFLYVAAWWSLLIKHLTKAKKESEKKEAHVDYLYAHESYQALH